MTNSLGMSNPMYFTGTSTFTTSYIASSLPRIAGEVLRRARYRFAHWRVGYRFLHGPGVVDTGTLGEGWSVLPDDGTHFYVPLRA